MIIEILALSVAVLLFGFPFFRIHRRRMPDLPIGQALASFADSRLLVWLIIAWSAAEATFWFIIPEFALLLILFVRTKEREKLLLAEITGTVIGTLLGYTIGYSLGPDRVASLLESIPYIEKAMVEQTAVWYQSLGLFGLMFQPFSGVPFKLFTLLGGAMHLPIISFVLFGLVVRMFRYTLVYAILLILSFLLHPLIRRYFIGFFLLCMILFTWALNATVANWSRPDHNFYQFVPVVQQFEQQTGLRLMRGNFLP